MFTHIAIAVLAIFLLRFENVAAQSVYTVWSSVVFTRTGERTPEALGGLPVVLTPLGANQSYSAGAFMRNRYLVGDTTDNGIGGGRIYGLSEDTIDYSQVYVGTLDAEYMAASAQAFMQGFYPPIGSKTDKTAPGDGVLADGTIVRAPLNNYQYPIVNTYDGNSSRYIFLGGGYNCPGLAVAQEGYEYTQDAANLNTESIETYQRIGPELLEGVLPSDNWFSAYAWEIFDYLNYKSIHDTATAEFFSGTNLLAQLRGWSDRQLQGWYGNLYATNNITDVQYPAPRGSISTIAGNFLASQLLGQLQLAVEYKAQTNKLNLLFGDFEPLMSFFALAGLPSYDPDFYGMADFASMAVFELFSYTDSAVNPTFPVPVEGNPDELWVRFYFRNGTNGDYQSYPLFGRGPDAISMTWEDFQFAMYELVPGGGGAWCEQCRSDAVFCAYWDPSFSLNADELSPNYKVTPVVAGVIGALVTLVVFGLLLAAIMLIGRFRIHRIYSQKNDLGGYKGSQKLASDKDLVLPKGGAVVTAEETPGSPVRGGHERVGSWELKQNEAGLPNIAAPTAERRPSYEDDEHPDIGDAPWQKPVEPHERV